MMRQKIISREVQEVNAGSMADIAFLLLIFFLVATTISKDKGLTLKLPPDVQEETSVSERNVFNISLNSANGLMVEGEIREGTAGLKEELRAFILNKGQDPSSSDSPAKAVISIKTNRGTAYERFIEILDEVKGTYYAIYADKAGISVEGYRALKLDNPEQKSLHEKGKEGIPMNISIAEPDVY